jgi:hypothetical protein
VCSSDLRFGIECAGRRSGCYRVRSGARRPELFIEREGIERVAHVSLHQSGAWHIKINDAVVHVWQRPAEFQAGYTRAVAIIQTPPVATATVPAHPEARGLPLVEGCDDAGHFDLFLEQPGASMQTRPGMRRLGTMLVGRLPLAEAHGTCCIVARRAPLPAMGARHMERPSATNLARMKTLAVQGRLLSTTFGELEDGTFALIDGRIEFEERAQLA